MAWTLVEEIKIKNWTTLVVAEKMKIEDIPEKYRTEVQYKVDHWFD